MISLISLAPNVGRNALLILTFPYCSRAMINSMSAEGISICKNSKRQENYFVYDAPPRSSFGIALVACRIGNARVGNLFMIFMTKLVSMTFRLNHRSDVKRKFRVKNETITRLTEVLNEWRHFLGLRKITASPAS